MEFLSVKWLWLYAGAALMFLELMAPGFVIFFFGLAAATVGGILFATDLSATAQVVWFTVLSIVYLVALRRVMRRLFMGDTEETKAISSEYVGRLGKVVETIRPEAPGRILLGDAEWSASADERLEPGTEVKVVDQRNLTMAVRKI